MKDALLAKLSGHRHDLLDLRKAISSVKDKQVRTKALKQIARSLSRQWFDEIKPDLKTFGVPDEILEIFSSRFTDLIKLADASGAKATYIKVLDDTVSHYKSELSQKIEVGSFASGSGLSIAQYLQGLPTFEESYLDEAQRCLSVNGIRASIVLGWCAVIARVHKKIEQGGFNKFNQASEDLYARDYGRFKGFRKKFRAENPADLISIFDTDLLWVLEFMQFIDSNEHTRLRHCFDLRNQSAHPGRAPIAPENLFAFYSDITKIILKNERFSLV